MLAKWFEVVTASSVVLFLSLFSFKTWISRGVFYLDDLSSSLSNGWTWMFTVSNLEVWFDVYRKQLGSVVGRGFFFVTFNFICTVIVVRSLVLVFLSFDFFS